MEVHVSQGLSVHEILELRRYYGFRSSLTTYEAFFGNRQISSGALSHRDAKLRAAFLPRIRSTHVREDDQSPS